MNTLILAVLAAVTLKDIPYYSEAELASAGEYQQTRCKLDIRYPEGETNFPTLVWFHGGGLVNGGKHFIPLRNEKTACVAVNYRLISEEKGVKGPECIEDAAAAVAWTLKNIAKYGGDPRRVYVSGSSAGGYLTMMVGMAPQYLAKYGFKPTDLAGIAPNSGQATTHFNVKKFSDDPRFKGLQEPSLYQPKIDEYAPLYYCGKDIPPIVAICGEPPWEWKGRAEENKLLIACCRALGHEKAWYVSLPYANHGRTIPAGYDFIEYLIEGRYPAPLENGVK